MGDGVCRNDVNSSKSCTSSQGRDLTDDTQTGGMCECVCCGSSKCKTCDHFVEGNVFTSNVTGRTYNVLCRNGSMNCATKNVIYLISCRKCGVQYVGETSQPLRSRFNNHRNRIKQLCQLYLYHHFSSDGHTLEDVSIVPIEEVTLNPSDGITVVSKRLQREEYWCRELCTVYPYGLNDNVKGVGNMLSRSETDDLIAYALFHKHERKYKKCKPRRRRKKVDSDGVRKEVWNRMLRVQECTIWSCNWNLLNECT